MLRWSPIVLWMAALNGCGGNANDKAPASDADADTDADADADADADTDTEVVAVISALAATVHPQFGSVIEATWTQDTGADTHVEFSMDGVTWMSSPTRTRPAGTHSELLLGTHYDSTVQWRVVTDNAETDGPSIQTGAIPPSIPRPSLNLTGAYDSDFPYVLMSLTQSGSNFGEPWWVMIVDRTGEPVWAKRSEDQRMSMHPRVALDGDGILMDQNQYWTSFGLGDDGTVDKLTLDGAIVQTWSTPGLHHPYQEMPDGSLAYGAFIDFYSESLKIRRPNGDLDTLWDCDSWMVSQGTIGANCASNTLNYDEASNTFLYSFFTFETVFQIDATSGATLAWFGPIGGSYAFDPPESHFWYQHGGHLTPEGTLLISTHQTEANHDLVAREYEIDSVNKTLHEVWNVGVDAGIIGNQMGDAYRLDGTDHTLQTFGTQARMREYLYDGTVVWDVIYPTTHIGRATALRDLYVLSGG
jgi:hypothetical protein